MSPLSHSLSSLHFSLFPSANVFTINLHKQHNSKKI
jgi:hypothetical protein